MADEIITQSVFSEHWANLSQHLDAGPALLLEKHLDSQPTVPTPANSTVVSPRLNEELVIPKPPSQSPSPSKVSGSIMGEVLCDELQQEKIEEAEVNQMLKESLQSYLEDRDSGAKEEGVHLVLSVILQLLQ